MPTAFAAQPTRQASAALRRAARLKRRRDEYDQEIDLLVMAANRGGHTYDEIRDALGVSRTTVTNTINRARTRSHDGRVTPLRRQLAS